MLNQRNSRKQGDVGIGTAIAYFTKNGHMVAVPLTDNQDYDLVVEIDKELFKVQVKTTRHKAPSGNYSAELRTTGGNQSWNGVTKFFDEKDADLLFILADNEDTWLIPVKELSVRSRITLGEKYDQYKV